MRKPNGKDSKPNNSHRKGKRPYNGNGKVKKTETKVEGIEANKDDVNDSSFYYTEEVLKNQLTNYTMTGFLGMPLSLGAYVSDTSSTGTKINLSTSLPSIMRLGIEPSLETTRLLRQLGVNGVTAGIGKVSLKNYYLLSANNAKTTQYQPNDVTMLILALGQVAAMVGHVKRIFGCMFKYNVRNRDLPQELITGMYIDYNDFKQNLANYRIRFNTILNMLNRLPIPGNVAYIAKWGSMYTNLYVDEYNNDLAQWYMMVPHTTWVFNEEKTDKGSGFDTLNVGAITNMGNLLAALENMINKITLSATFNYIFADILRLSDKSGLPLLKFQMLLEDYDAPVLFSEEFNLWVDNADITGFPKETPTDPDATPFNDVYTNVADGSIVYDPRFAHKEVDMNGILNFKDGNPDIEKKIAATRLKHMRIWPFNDNNEAGFACGDMYLSFIDVLYGNPTATTREWGHGFMTQNGYESNNISPAALNTMLALSQFNYAPKVVVHTANDTDNMNSVIQGSMDFFTRIDTRVLYEMWDAEWLGLLEMR